MSWVRWGQHFFFFFFGGGGGQFPFLVGDYLPYVKCEGGKVTVDSSINKML